MSIASPASELERVALFRYFPELATRVSWLRLGDWPTPVEPLPRPGEVVGGDAIYVKRDDISSPRYGGNKVRTLEAHLGLVVASGAHTIWATGAYGSNHSVATVTHAPRAGLSTGVALFPQPPTATAQKNLSATLAARPAIVTTPWVGALPLSMAAIAVRGRRDPRGHYLMAPGGASPVGALGHVSAGLEIAEQIEAGACPPPRRIVLAVGSTCTTAGLLVGLRLAERLGVGFGSQRPLLPRVWAVRVSPWPITSQRHIVHLAARTASMLETLIGPRAKMAAAELAAGLTVDGRYLGAGYGRPTATGRAAIARMRRAGGPPLDLVYTAKSGAALFELARRGVGPLLFIATKSSAPLLLASGDDIARAPRAMRAWLSRRPLAAT